MNELKVTFIRLICSLTPVYLQEYFSRFHEFHVLDKMVDVKQVLVNL